MQCDRMNRPTLPFQFKCKLFFQVVGAGGKLTGQTPSGRPNCW